MDINREKLMKFVFFLASIFSVIAVLTICLFLIINGIPAIQEIGFWGLITGVDWSPVDKPPSFGIFPMLVGSIFVTAGAIVIGVPIGILTATFLSYNRTKKFYKPIKNGINLLAGIPSIIYGFFGISIIVPLVRNFFGGSGNSILSASILLGIMILPTVISMCESTLNAIPSYYYEGAIALGADHYRSVFAVVLPAAKSGIISAVILGIGRAIGETMAVVMVAGNQARMPNSIFGGVRTLTANIVLEMGYAAGLHRSVLITSGLVLFVFIMIINICFSIIKERDKR